MPHPCRPVGIFPEPLEAGIIIPKDESRRKKKESRRWRLRVEKQVAGFSQGASAWKWQNQNLNSNSNNQL